MSQLERQLSYQDIRDAPPLANQHQPLRYIDVRSSRYKRPPRRFVIEPVHESTNQDGHFECRPGCTFEGAVRLSLSEPLGAQRLKLVFKGVETPNYEAMGWGKHHKPIPLFSVRTFLWGKTDDDTTDTWPVMETGEHTFRFICEMPLVNYPPSINTSFLRHSFDLIASLERPGERPFHSSPCPVHFVPFVQTVQQVPASMPTGIRESVSVGVHQILVTLASTAFTIGSDSVIPIHLDISHTKHHASTLQAKIFLAQFINVTKDTFKYCKRLIVQDADIRLLQSGRYKVSLPLSSTLCPMLGYSPRVRIEYHLKIHFKYKHGALLSKKHKVSIPLMIGTVPAGIAIPRGLLSYTDDEVTQDTTLRTKPQFLRHSVAPPSPSNSMTELPPYDDCQPPAYELV